MGGHVFVVRGRLEEIAHDAAVVPVDRWLAFNPVWDALLGDRPEAPPTWGDGWGRVSGRDQWLVEVGDGDYSRVLERLGRAIEDIAASPTGPPVGGRLRQLVVLPVLGIGLGGHGHEQGKVLADLLAAATELATRTDLDLAVVSPDRSVVGAAQFLRRHEGHAEHAVERLARRLGEMAKADELALFVGAGVSMGAGLPSWSQLIQELGAALPEARSTAFDALGATDQAELIEAADKKGFKARVVEIVTRASRPALLHGLLAGLDVRQAVTTNYDQFYERAVRASGEHLSSVLPWDSALGSRRWVLKLHGDVDHPESIVLTRRHMVRYDAANRPSAALLQSMLLTRHLLVVGASLTDDNVLRLAHEVQAYREAYMPTNKQAFGTQLDASEGGDRLRAALWEGQLDFVHLDDLGEDSPRRALELVLDRAGVHASDDASWLLDPRFEGLLEVRDKPLAQQVRALAEQLRRSGGSTWRPLLDRLDELGSPH